ncbi:substrate-binding domain-containing protein [Telmatospirillum sp.]|uniref:substrate-binding domain-containing protein n=1 Tax=Telmatospirillum sp. TaxID=2079197 RepID=UPI00283EDCAD|nr:substrate-binding domain-containing protein [Telmatospirillum sp.]MDR3436045.1 substrate-binding domain-containing protein [Telmatospirillum sp.]
MRAGFAAMLVVLTCLGARPVLAAEVKVVTVGAFHPIVAALAADFERGSGDTLVEVHDTAGALLRRIENGERFDLVILTLSAIIDLTAHGKLSAGQTARLARVGIGVAVKEGAPMPSIGDVEAFKQALLAAPSVAYIDPAAGGSSGIYLDQLFGRLGIAGALKDKAVLVQGGLVGDRVVAGDAAIGLQQISELLAVKGLHLVGPLPEAIQNYTLYAGGVSSETAHAEAAERLLDFLQSDAAIAVLKAKGMAPPRD